MIGCPTVNSGWGVVAQFHQSSNNNMFQIATKWEGKDNAPRLFVRMYDNGDWSPWGEK